MDHRGYAKDHLPIGFGPENLVLTGSFAHEPAVKLPFGVGELLQPHVTAPSLILCRHRTE
jgi:hypothetical protein